MSELVCFGENLTIPQNAGFDETYFWTADGVAVDLTGCTARMQLRRTFDSPDPALLTISTTPNANGSKIVLGGVAGSVELVISPIDTALLSGTGVYDVLITYATTAVQRFMAGTFNVTPGVTR